MNITAAPAIYLPAREVLLQIPNLTLYILAKFKLEVPLPRGCHNVVMLEPILAPLILVNPHPLDRVLLFQASRRDTQRFVPTHGHVHVHIR